MIGKKKTRPTKTSTRSNGAQITYVVPVDEIMENYLYDTLESEDGAIVETAKGWVDGFGHTPLQCVKDLVNLILKSSGCEVEIPIHEIEEPDTAPATLNQLQSQAHKHIPFDYPLISKDKKFKAVKSHFPEFFSKLIQVAHSSSVLYENDDLLGHIRTWIVAMSSMGLRAIRHTTTVALLAMMRELCRLRAELQSSIATQERNNSNSKKNKKRGGDGASKESQEKAKKMDKIIDDFYNQVFMHRSKDVDSRIRKDCWKFLGYATRTYREKYFNSASLNRFSYALSDPDHSVRLEAIYAIQNLHSADVEAPLRTFIARYMSRLVSIAVNDSDLSVRRAVLDLLLDISSNDETSISEEEMKSIILLIFDSDARIKLDAAKFFVHHVTELAHENVQSLSTTLSKHRIDETWVQYKVMASELNRLVQTENGDNSHANTGRAIVERPLDELRHLFEMAPPVNRIVSVSKAIKEASLTEFNEEWAWDSLAVYLRYDFSSISNRRDREKISSELQLDDESEKLVLLDVLHGFINHWTEGYDSSSKTNKKGSRKTKTEVETEVLDIEHAQSELVQEVPKLLEEFKSSSSSCAEDAMVKVIQIACLIDQNTYLYPNRETEQIELLKEIVKQYETQTSLNLLTECCRFFSKALKIKEFEETVKDELDRFLALARGELIHLLKNASSESDIPTATLTPILTRFEYLSYLVDTTRLLEEPIDGSVRDTLSNRLLDSVDKVMKNKLTDRYLGVISGLFRSYVLWKLYIFLTEVPSSTSSEDYDAETFNSILEHVQNVSMIPSGSLSKGNHRHLKTTTDRSFDQEFYTIVNCNLLDMFTAIQSLEKQVRPGSYGSKVLGNVDVELTIESKKDIMLLFILKEREYLKETDNISRTRENKVDKLVLQHDSRHNELNDEDDDNESVDLDLESDGESEAENNDNNNNDNDENPQVHNSRLLILDFDLCKLAAKIALSGILNIIGDDFIERLKLNSNLLSPKFQRAVINTVIDPKGDQQKKSSKRKRKNNESVNDNNNNILDEINNNDHILNNEHNAESQQNQDEEMEDLDIPSDPEN